jgi:hypothetical protein
MIKTTRSYASDKEALDQFFKLTVEFEKNLPDPQVSAKILLQMRRLIIHLKDKLNKDIETFSRNHPQL